MQQHRNYINHTWCYIFAGVLACSGCVSEKQFPEPTLNTPTSYFSHTLDTPNLNAFIQSHYPKPLKWDADTLTLAALYYNPALNTAVDGLQLAKAGEITAGQRPNPTLNFGLGRDKTLTHPFLFDLGLNLPIETGNKREIRVEQAKYLSSAAVYQIGAAVWQIRSRVMHALIDMDSAQALVAFYKKQADSLKVVLDVFDVRAAQGQIPSVTASQTRISYQQAVLSEKEAEKLLSEARATLSAAMGVPVMALQKIDIDTSFLNAPPKDMPFSPETALKQNNALLASLAEYNAAHSALQLEIAKQIPDLNIGPSYEWTGDGNKLTLGISLNLPIFNNNEGPIAEAAAKCKIAADAFNTLQADIIGKMETARASLTAARSKLVTADNLLSAQKEKQKLLQTQLKPGEASKLPLLLAQSEIYTSEISRHDAWVQVLNARVALEDASQQLQFGKGFIKAIPVPFMDKEVR